ncbi:MAG: ABC transporter substrate-binding protein [Elusimicrobia bacterium]|nr:ABC transporter substrate-binding protein [Elusimicrobiota bacterium]
MRAIALLLLLAAPAAYPQPGAVLRVCDDVVDPPSLNPLKEFSEKNHTIIQQIFDGLVRFDPEGNVEPALASDWRWIDEKTLEMRLRPGVRFHDGEPMNAESVRFSLEKFVDPKSGFPGAGFLGSIERVEVVDAETVRIKTRFPDGILLNRLAGLVTIMPPRYIAARGEEYFGAHPVGTGAFRFVSWEAGSKIVLEANEHYWADGYPKFRGLVFHFLPVDKQVSGLLDGTIDVVTELPGTATLKVVKSGIADVVKKESFYTIGSSVNVSSGPLADKRVRQAINHAINREELVRYDLLGNGKPLATLSMAGETGHDPSLRPYAYDPDKARRLLREAGYPNGVKLRAIVKMQGERTMRIISTHLARVGIVVDQYLSTDGNTIQEIRDNYWDFTMGGCPDPMAHSFFIQSVFLSSFSPFSIARSAEYDRLLGKMVTALDAQEQERAGMELDRYVYEQALGVFTYQRVKTYGVSKAVSFVPSITGMSYFHLSRPAGKIARAGLAR